MNGTETKQLFEELGYIRAKVEKIDGMEKDIKDLKRKMNWIYGYASGVALTVSIAFLLLKEKVWDAFR